MIIGINGKIGSGKDLVGGIIQYLTATNIPDEDLKSFILNNKILIYSKWEVRKFADKLKDIVCLLTGCTREQLEDQEFKNKELGEEWKVSRLVLGSRYGVSYRYFNTLQEARKESRRCHNFEINKTEEYTLTYRSLLQLLGTDCGRNIIHPNIWVNSLMNEYPKKLETLIEKEVIFNKPTPLEDTTNNQKEIKFKCHCGKIFVSTLWRVNKGHTKSCSCYQKYKASITKKTHGDSNSRLLSIYKNMKTRCTNKNSEVYKKYGEKGITICESWLGSYEVFKKWAIDNGYEEHLSLDRRDTLGNYEPNNCRWVLLSEQSKNKGTYANNTLGVRGVSKIKTSGKFRAQIQNSGKKIIIGQFDTIEEASIAYEKQRNILFDIKEIVPKFIEDEINWIVTDVRYPNELKAVKDRGGISIRIVRHTHPHDTNPNTEHESEKALDGIRMNYEIYNDGTIEDLIEKVRVILITEKII